jgi:plastocyanin
MSGRRIVYGAVVAALTLAATGCSSDSSTTDTGGSTTGGSTGGGSADQTITIKDFTFNPSTLTVSGSTTIEVTNDDSTQHSQVVQPGTSETVTIHPSASIGWHCEFHPTTMKGSITVG